MNLKELQFLNKVIPLAQNAAEYITQQLYEVEEGFVPPFTIMRDCLTLQCSEHGIVIEGGAEEFLRTLPLSITWGDGVGKRKIEVEEATNQ